jgi:NAD-dependent deacetylase
MDEEPVVEPRRCQIANMGLEHDRLQAEVTETLVPARMALEVVDARHLEPYEVVRVVDDPLRVGLREADAHFRCETEAVHEGAMLAELIVANQPCVVLTGAGVSTESGIPDFRSPSGVWAAYDPYEVASVDGFRRDPARVWEFYTRRLAVLADAQPNPGHRALAQLEARGLVQAVITQNVDRLHAIAGSRDVVEVHGSIASASCPRCGRREERERVRDLLPLPRCLDCAAILKPDVVMFGEVLPAAAIERATALAQAAGLLLVVGSSLEVWPVAGLPDETLRHGGLLAIVNREPTPYDRCAALVLHGSAAGLLAECALRA